MIIVRIYFYGLMLFLPDPTGQAAYYAVLPDTTSPALAEVMPAGHHAEAHEPKLLWREDVADGTKGTAIGYKGVDGKKISFAWAQKEGAAFTDEALTLYEASDRCAQANSPLPCSKDHARNYTWFAPLDKLSPNARLCGTYDASPGEGCAFTTNVKIDHGTLSTCSLFGHRMDPLANRSTVPIEKVKFTTTKDGETQTLYEGATAEVMVLEMKAEAKNVRGFQVYGEVHGSAGETPTRVLLKELTGYKCGDNTCIDLAITHQPTALPGSAAPHPPGDGAMKPDHLSPALAFSGLRAPAVSAAVAPSVEDPSSEFQPTCDLIRLTLPTRPPAAAMQTAPSANPPEPQNTGSNIDTETQICPILGKPKP